MDFINRYLSHSARAYLYRVLFALSALGGVYNLTDPNETALWLSLGAALLGNGIAVLTTDNARSWIYGVAVAAAALAAAYNLLGEEEAALWVGVISAVIGNGLATVNSATGSGWDATPPARD